MIAPAAPTHVSVIHRRSRAVRTPRRHISPNTKPTTPASMKAPVGSGLGVVMMCSYSALATARRSSRVDHSDIGEFLSSRRLLLAQSRMIQPPSTEIVWPLIHSPAGEHSRSMVPIKSAGGPEVFPGICAPRISRNGESFGRLTYPLSLSTSPGAIPLTLMPRPPSSAARLHVSPCSAYFETP